MLVVSTYTVYVYGLLHITLVRSVYAKQDVKPDRMLYMKCVENTPAVQTKIHERCTHLSHMHTCSLCKP